MNTVSINVIENVSLRSFYENVVSTKAFAVTLGAVPNFKNKYSQEIKRLICLKEIIQIRGLKRLMRLQDKTCKNCRTWMPACKEWGSNLDKCLSPWFKNNLKNT